MNEPTKIKAEDFKLAPHQKPRPYSVRPQFLHPENWSILKDINWKESKIILEVGCGTGLWSIQQAKSHPENIYIAVEKTHDRSRTLLRRIQEEKLTNCIGLQADAVLLCASCFPDESVAEIHILHPNPWPKKNQANKRFIPSPQFYVFDRILKKKGLVVVASNVPAYADEASDHLQRYWSYTEEFRDFLSAQAQGRTAFEIKYLLEGLPIKETRLRKP